MNIQDLYAFLQILAIPAVGGLLFLIRNNFVKTEKVEADLRKEITDGLNTARLEREQASAGHRTETNLLAQRHQEFELTVARDYVQSRNLQIIEDRIITAVKRLEDKFDKRENNHD
jgi:hypothetical protein